MPPDLPPGRAGSTLLVYRCNMQSRTLLDGDYCGLLARWALGACDLRGVTVRNLFKMSKVAQVNQSNLKREYQK